MPLLGDLGISAAVLLPLLLVVAPLFAALVRRRWRRSAARKEEVRRLMLLAAAEEQRMELEAAAASYTAAPVEEAPAPVSTVAVESNAEIQAPAPPPRPVCALCFGPATGRCARCKAVRYCSGKCQIVHWRQGHKDECHPPDANDNENTAQVNIVRLNREKSKKSGSSNNNSELESQTGTKVVENFSKRSSESTSLDNADEDQEVAGKPSLDTSGETNRSEFFTHAPMSSEPTFSRSSVKFTDVTVHGEAVVSDDAGLGESSPSNAFSRRHKIAVDNNDDKSEKKLTLKVARHLENSIPLSSEMKHNVLTSQTNEVQSSSGLSDRAASFFVSNENTGHSKTGGENQVADFYMRKAQGVINNIYPGVLSNSKNAYSESKLPETTRQSEQREKQACLIEEFAPTPTDLTKEPLFQKKDTFKSSSPSSNQLLFDEGDHPIPVHKSMELDSASKGSSSSLACILPNGLTAVKRVAKTLNAPKISGHYPSEKMIFPYDLFIKLYNEKVEFHPFGLNNCGNSCYANAVLQCLAFTRPLTAYLLGGLHSKICRKKEWCFMCEFENIVVDAKKGKSPLSPFGMLSHLDSIGCSFDRGKEEDAHEFLRYAIDAMQSICLNEAGTKSDSLLLEETTLIQQTFGGYLRSRIKCSRCKGKSEKCERMLDLTVEVNGDIGSLEEALLRFTSIEILDGENRYKCDRCKSHERAKKKLSVLEAPNVLTIALKRFQSGKFGKLNKVVRFFEYLDLAPYMSGTDDKSPIYGLYAVVVHIDSMNSCSSGHYICYVKDAQGKWYRVDDNKVKPVELEKVLSENAYLLFYTRCSPHAPSSVRKSMAHKLMQVNKVRNKEVKWPNYTSLHRSPLVQSGRQSYLHRVATDDSTNFRASDLFDKRLRPHLNDSSSDSCFSEEGSWSTDSTRDSSTTEELWEYFLQ